MGGQRFLIHVVRVCTANLQLNDEVDEDRLAHTVLISSLQLLMLVVLDRPRQCCVDKLPPVGIGSLTLLGGLFPIPSLAPELGLFVIWHGRFLHGASPSLEPDSIYTLTNELTTLLFLALIAGLLDEVAATVVAPDLVQAHGKLVVAMRKHGLEVKLLLGGQLTITLALPCITPLALSIFFHHRFLLFEDIVELCWL